jgi:hypothetical protein
MGGVSGIQKITELIHRKNLNGKIKYLPLFGITVLDEQAIWGHGNQWTVNGTYHKLSSLS